MRSIDNRRLKADSAAGLKKVKDRLETLAKDLATKPANERKDYIGAKRLESWGAEDLKEILFSAVGRKCWYSEISLAGADVNVDHFRPKGKVKEVDFSHGFVITGQESDGYWWLAFDLENFRLSSQHANQRRVDQETEGGKWDFFPVIGTRAIAGTKCSQIQEQYLALDPCSASDVRLLAFDSFGQPIWSGVAKNDELFSRLRVDFSIWLYHLNKGEINIKRAKAVEEIGLLVEETDSHYQNWQLDMKNARLKRTFDNSVARLKQEILESSEFSSAKKYKIKLKATEYEWIDQYVI